MRKTWKFVAPPDVTMVPALWKQFDTCQNENPYHAFKNNPYYRIQSQSNPSTNGTMYRKFLLKGKRIELIKIVSLFLISFLERKYNKKTERNMLK